MTKHILTYAFFLIFTPLASAQLILTQIGSNQKHAISAGTSIDLTFLMKTSAKPEKAFHRYNGLLKQSDSTHIGIVLTYEDRYFVNKNGTSIHETRRIQPPDTPIVLQIPSTKLQSIVQHLPKNKHISNAGTLVFALAALSNLFIAPHLKDANNKKVRNAGFIAMGIGLSTAFLPTRRTYYFEQPKNGSKRLWTLVRH